MNDILTLNDLSNLIMVKHNMTKEDADKFVNGFLSIIEEGLICDRYVRIKGLGTFKLIEDNITDKLSSNKIVFVPDSVLKDSVNKPFAHFESIILNDNVHFDDINETILPNDNIPVEKEAEDDRFIENRYDNKTTEQQEIVAQEVELKKDCLENNMVCLDRVSNNIQWKLILSFLFIGVVIGATVSWFIYKRTLITDLGKITEGIVANKAVDDIFVDTLSKFDIIDVRKDTGVVEREEVDSVLESVDIVKVEENKQELTFYSDKNKYKITGTLESYIIKKGNTLAKISYKYYKNKKMWPYIVLHNKKIIKDPNNVPIGTTIDIPKLELME